MSEVQDRKKFLDKDYTRRQFLKISGKSLAGLAISSSLLNVLCVSENSSRSCEKNCRFPPLKRF